MSLSVMLHTSWLYSNVMKDSEQSKTKVLFECCAKSMQMDLARISSESCPNSPSLLPSSLVWVNKILMI